jgi:hypothetical protein
MASVIYCIRDGRNVGRSSGSAPSSRANLNALARSARSRLQLGRDLGLDRIGRLPLLSRIAAMTLCKGGAP